MKLSDPNPMAKYIGDNPAYCGIWKVEHLLEDIAMRKRLRAGHIRGGGGYVHYSGQIKELEAALVAATSRQRDLFTE